MKKLIIAAIFLGTVSLGFTVVNKSSKVESSVKTQTVEKLDFSQKLNEKRLASWD